jgi:radical SAM protein with 4Fe4S-binding SPASM domain
MRSQPHANAAFPVFTDAGWPVLSEEVISAAARLVAANCAAKTKPLTLVLHGGGEPTVHWELLKRVRKTCSTIADENNVGVWAYIATHGVLAEDRVRWLARHFDLVGLSCDGPPGVQNINRPSTATTATSATVERTAHVLNAEGANYVVRATITPETVSRQSEIVEFLNDRLFARTLRFEPAYVGRRGPGRHFLPNDADKFVLHFTAARKTARDRRCDLQLSSVRLDEIHGPFCHPLRNVLQLTPTGNASACFLTVGNDALADGAMVMGRLDPSTGTFLIDKERVASQRQWAAQIPGRCRECHNVYHCARDCPDVCLLAEHSAPEHCEGFRCRVQKLFARHQIFEMAATT